MSCKDFTSALSYLWEAHPKVLLVFIIISFSDKAVTSEAVLYIKQALHFTALQQNYVIMILGSSSVVVQVILIPLMTSLGINQYFLLLVCVMATWAHIATYAFVSSPVAFYCLEPLGGFCYAALSCAIGIISGVPSTGAQPFKDQGILLGTVQSIQVLATPVSPLVAGALTSSWHNFAPPFNFAGIGFATMSAIMLPAVPISAWAWLCNWRCQVKSSDQSTGCSLRS